MQLKSKIKLSQSLSISKLSTIVLPRRNLKLVYDGNSCSVELNPPPPSSSPHSFAKVLYGKEGTEGGDNPLSAACRIAALEGESFLPKHIECYSIQMSLTEVEAVFECLKECWIQQKQITSLIIVSSIDTTNPQLSIVF